MLYKTHKILILLVIFLVILLDIPQVWWSTTGAAPIYFGNCTAGGIGLKPNKCKCCRTCVSVAALVALIVSVLLVILQVWWITTVSNNSDHKTQRS